MIRLSGISKAFRVPLRKPGAINAAKALFRREYRRIDALTDVGFEISAGEIVGYIGPNGAGKSTTIKVMSGILIPDAGECRILDSTPWKDRRRYVRDIGVVFGQRTQLWWDVPVIDSFQLLRNIYRIPEAEYGRTLEELSGALELSDLLHTPLRQLSLGQRMRCEIAGSLLHGPKILFLDEPTIGLDAVSKLAVRAFIRRLNAERGVTVLLTTHDMNDIEALTDRIILIGKGRILFDGPMRGLRDRYDNTRLITLEFEPVASPPPLPHGVSLVSWSAERAELSVDLSGQSVAGALSALGESLSVRDMTSQGRPVEEIIASLYREHRI